MNIIGISAFYHDSACCLLRDGDLVAAAQEERFSRVKGDHRLPVHAFRYCLSEGGLHPGELDAVAYYEIPEARWERQSHWGHPRSPTLDPRLLIERQLGYDGPVRTFPHHTSHAASAFLYSPFESAAVFTADGVGEWATTTYGAGNGENLQVMEEVRFPHSIGLLYAALTAWLGFSVNEGEGTVMALAAHGRPRKMSAMKELLRSGTKGGFELALEHFRFDEQMGAPSLFDVLKVPPRFPGSELAQEHMDLAASLQAAVEEVLLEKIGYLRRLSGEDRLCMAGGVALNCVANGRLAREAGFREVFIQPAAGDAGGALGAAALALIDLTGGRPQPMRHLFLGPRYDAEDFLLGTALESRDYSDDEGGLIADIVNRLDRGEVMGWFQGRMEFGPRALGARSILADPRHRGMRHRINLEIKRREWFRPFAASVRVESAAVCLDGPVASPHMLITCPVEGSLEAVSHVDGSTRPQLVSRESAPRFWRLLTEWERRTGCPALLNTSFNTRGEPIVCTPADALFSTVESGIDTLVLENHVIDAVPEQWHDLVPSWRGPRKRANRQDLYTF